MQPRLNIHKLATLEEQLVNNKKIHKKNQKEAEKLRNEDLDRLAAKRAEQWNIKASQAIVVIKSSEESRKVY